MLHWARYMQSVALVRVLLLHLKEESQPMSEQNYELFSLEDLLYLVNSNGPKLVIYAQSSLRKKTPTELPETGHVARIYIKKCRAKKIGVCRTGAKK